VVGRLFAVGDFRSPENAALGSEQDRGKARQATAPAEAPKKERIGLRRIDDLRLK
jgi:hypothetical protein